MKLYIYRLINDETTLFGGLFTPKCTEEYIAEHYDYIGETDQELETENININGQLYRWCASNLKCNAMFYQPYSLEDKTQWNKEIENINNAICPVCGNVDYDAWEEPDGEYICPQCHSTLDLRHKTEIHYDASMTFWYKTKLIKRFVPKKIKLKKV